MAGFSGREMCLSQSQPLDHINASKFLRKGEGGRHVGGGKTGKKTDEAGGKQSFVGQVCNIMKAG